MISPFKTSLLALSMIGVAALAGCANDAQVASSNLSQAADNFQIARRIVFYNGITGEYILTIEGLCSQDASPGKFVVTCKVSNGFKKHFLGLSNNVTYFSEQVEPAAVGTSQYRVTFKPSVLLPSIDVR